MKRVLLVVLVAIVFYSCQKETDPIFNQSADERLNANVSKYTELLRSAKYGWKAEYFPMNLATGGWSFIFKFKENGTVAMMADFNKNTATTEQETHYRVSSVHIPSLIFDSYSMLHVLSDPGLGNTGSGFKGDFEFEIREYKNDTLYLLGHFDNSLMKLVKATEKDVNLEKQLIRRSELKNYFTDDKSKPYFKTLTLGSTTLDISYNDSKKRMVFKYLKDGKVFTSSRALAFTSNGAVLSSPLMLPGVSKSITEIPFASGSAGSLNINLDSYGVKASIAHSDFPVVPYLDGARDIQILKYLNVLRVSPSLVGLFDKIEDIPFFKDIQFLFGVEDKEQNTVHNSILVYAPETSQKVNWYEYNVEWSFDEKGIMRAKYKGTTTGTSYESTLKPFIDQVCNGDGYTVLNVEAQPYSESTFYSITLISRGDSRDRITLYTFM